MANNVALPSSHAPLVGEGGLTTPQYYKFFLSVANSVLGTASEADITALQSEITALQQAIANLPAQDYPTLRVTPPIVSIGLLQNGLTILSINTANSVDQSTGSLQLLNDTASPGNTYFYGTGPTGTKGWNTIAAALAAGTNITLSTGSDGVTTINSTASGGILPVVTGGVQNAQPTFVYFDDGSLMYAEAA